MVVRDKRSNIVDAPKGPAAAVITDHKPLRRIIAEDPDWSLATVPLLKDIALNHIVQNFENNPILTGLHPKDKLKVLEKINTKIPLKVTAHLVEDESYWKRCCKVNWKICDVSMYAGSWKRMFFEKHMESLIENFVPEQTDDKVISDALQICSRYIKRINITQLLPPVKDQPKGDDLASEIGSDAGSEMPSTDHFEFGEILEKLPHLEEFRVRYGVRNCGMNFEWNLFQFTQRDCLLLAKSIKNCRHLKVFCLHQSKVDDAKVRVLISHMLDHPALTELDLSHNCIGDRGARAIAKLINSSSKSLLGSSGPQLPSAPSASPSKRCPNLRKVNLCDNIIRVEGAKAIAYALSKNTHLHELDIRLNRIADEGGQAIAKSLLKNNTLKKISLSSNDLSERTGAVLSQVLQVNTSLASIDISGNRIGTDGGKQIQEGMEVNKTLLELDLRLTEAGQESEYCINQSLKANKEAARNSKELTGK